MKTPSSEIGKSIGHPPMAVCRPARGRLLLWLPLLLTATAASAQSNFAFDPFTVDGGGEASTGGAYSIKGTAGQPDAGQMSGGTYAIRGGFWHAYAAVQHPSGSLKLVILPGRPMQLLLHGATGRTVKIMASDSLGAQANWTVIATTNSSVTPCVVCNLTPTISPRFFRAMLVSGNQPPVLQPIGAKQVAPGQALSFTAVAQDPDAGQTLTFSLDPGAPAGASIGAISGVFNWTPSAAGNYPVTVRVTDNGEPPLSDTEAITVTVGVQTNQSPVLDPIGSKTIAEETTLTFAASATDPDAGQTLSFSLAPGHPTGAAITSGGDFNWTPTEAQGPGSYPVTVIVTDNGTPAQSDSETISVTVNEANKAPVLAPIGNRSVEVNTPLSFIAAATDPDRPPQTLTFGLVNAPAGATLDPNSGSFTWTPTVSGTNTLTVTVTDNGQPPLSASETIAVRVAEGGPGSLRVDAIESSVVMEGYNWGGSPQSGWPVALFGSGFGANPTVASSDPHVSIGTVSVSLDGTVAAFPVSIDAIPTLARGQTQRVTLTVSAAAQQTDVVLTIVGLNELDLTDGAILPRQGVFSRLTLPAAATVTSANQLLHEDAPNLLVTGSINLQGTLNLDGKGYPGGSGGERGSGGVSGGGTRSGYDGGKGGGGRNGGGPYGGAGGNGGTGGAGTSSSYQGYAGEQGAPGDDAGHRGTSQSYTNVISPSAGVPMAVLPGAGGGGGGGQGGQGGGQNAYGEDGKPGHRGGDGGGALRLRGLGGWIVDGSHVSQLGRPGELSLDRGGSGGWGEDGALWLAGSRLQTGGQLALATGSFIRLDAPPNHGITNAVTGGHGPVWDRSSLPSVTNVSHLLIRGWVLGGHYVRAVVTDLKTGGASQFDSPNPFGTAGTQYVPFTLNIELVSGFNRIELLSGPPLSDWPLHNWVPSAEKGLIRVFNLNQASSGFVQSDGDLLPEFEDLVGITIPLGPDPTLNFPARQFTETEPNNTAFATANNAGALAIGQKLVLTGGLSTASDKDAFIIQVPKGAVTVKLDCPGVPETYLVTTILDDNNSVLYYYRDKVRVSSAIRSLMMPHDSGPYQKIGVLVLGSQSGSYTVTLTAESPGKAYLPRTVLSPTERLWGEWGPNSSATQTGVSLSFAADLSCQLMYTQTSDNSKWWDSEGTFEVLDDVAAVPGWYLWWMSNARPAIYWNPTTGWLQFNSYVDHNGFYASEQEFLRWADCDVYR